MKVIEARNINKAFQDGMVYLRATGTVEQSRGGPVLVAPGPVCTVYHNPAERVFFNPVRDANPFFHLMEAIWMLAGSNDVAFVSQFNKGMKKYSDDDVTYHGAYGYRWRNQFGFDQISKIVELLKRDPETRRAVLTMWSPDLDLDTASLDIPCNTQIYFDCRKGLLNMTVTCRSNDALWGAYGANVVHMSVLQEYVATAVGLPMGDYRQFSNNFHAYLEAPKVKELLDNPFSEDPYSRALVRPRAMVDVPETFLLECQIFVDDPMYGYPYENSFFPEVMLPMFMLWESRHADWIHDIRAPDWALACMRWLERRAK